jgi:exosortase
MNMTIPESAIATAAAPKPLKRWAMFVGLLAAATVAGLPGVIDLVAYSRTNDSASHVVLIPLVSAALIWMNRSTVFATVGTSLPGAGVVAIGIAASVAAATGALPGGAAAGMFWSIAGTVTAWIGAFLLVFGAAAFNAAVFPLLFLAFTVPLPDALIAEAVGLLKAGSTAVVASLFALTGTPHLRSGFVFELPGFVIEIADECSGIRSSIALMLTSLLAGHLFLDSPWRKAVLVGLVLPVAIVKNAIRIVTLSLLAIHVDPSFLVGQLHHDGGVMFFVLAVAMLIPILSLLRASETRWRGLLRVLHPSTR